MRQLSLILLFGFISLSIFGFVGMLESSAMEHASNSCLASLAQNGACPPEGNTVASAIFHTNAFKVFSTSTLSVVVVLAALMLIFIGFVKPFLVLYAQGAHATVKMMRETLTQYLALKDLKLALARFEHSPTAS